jgi:hypothetical protein
MHNKSTEIKELAQRIKDGWWKNIDIDEGWHQIVLDCHKELLAIDPNYIPLQVKEKFGGLRYYIEISDSCREPKALGKIISKYEEIAARTCEATGGPGVLMKSIGGWYKTLNPEYADKNLHYAKYKVVKQGEGE